MEVNLEKLKEISKPRSEAAIKKAEERKKLRQKNKISII